MLENINNIAPSAYHVRSAIKQYAQDQAEAEPAIKNRCPNYLHKDGKIYASKPGEEYVAVTVSPYHSNFESQIEPAVLPMIKALINKGYLTVSCCGGHTDPWWEFYFVLVAGTTEQTKQIVESLSSVNNTHIEVFQNLANVHQHYSNGKIKFRPLEELECSSVEEYKDLNVLFNRTYSSYNYIKVRFHYEPFALIFNPFNIFASHVFHKKEIYEFDLWKKNMLNYIINDLESFYG